MERTSGEPMTILRCDSCGALYPSPKYLCTKCGSDALIKHVASGLGSIYTHTTIRVAPDTFKDQAPYDVAVIEMQEGLKVTARVKRKSEEPLRIGQQVRYLGETESGYWFEG